MESKIPISISESGLEEITKRPYVFTDVLKNHLFTNAETNSPSMIKGVKLFQPMSVSEESLYVMKNGALVELSPFSKETAELLVNNPDYLNEIVESMEYQADEIKRYIANPDDFVGQ